MPTQKNKRITTIDRAAFVAFLAILVIAACGTAQARPIDEQLQNLEHRWAQASYELVGSDRTEEFARLLEDARGIAAMHPDSAKALAWQGIIASTYMDTKGRFRRKRLAIEARDALLKAESRQAGAVSGLVYANLGALYAKVPGGLAGFGNDSKAVYYFWKAISADPHGVESNYRYAQYLLREKKYAAARTALLKARRAATGPNAPATYRGRQRQLALMMDLITRKIGEPDVLLADNRQIEATL